jgi:hypothetical protein
MRKFIAVLAVLLLGIPVLPIAVSAHEDTSATQEVHAATSEATAAREKKFKAEVESVESTDVVKLKARLEERKTTFKQTLSVAAKARLAARCEAAQNSITKVKEAGESMVAARIKVYDKVIDKLDDLSVKASTAGLEVTTLNEQVNTLETNVHLLSEQLTVYRQALADLTAHKCTEDVEGFRATLDAAKDARSDAHKTAKDIRSYITATIKPTIQDLKSQLEAEKTDGEQ